MNEPRKINDTDYSISELQEYIKHIKKEYNLLLTNCTDEVYIDKYFQYLQHRKAQKVSENLHK